MTVNDSRLRREEQPDRDDHPDSGEPKKPKMTGEIIATIVFFLLVLVYIAMKIWG